MILRRPHEFKIATLQDIRSVFPPHWNPFYGGFGNRDTDEISYREVRGWQLAGCVLVCAVWLFARVID